MNLDRKGVKSHSSTVIGSRSEPVKTALVENVKPHRNIVQFCRYGRKNVVFGSLAINIILRIISVFIVNYNYYLLLVVTALGTTFSPMGIRLAVTLVAE